MRTSLAGWLSLVALCSCGETTPRVDAALEDAGTDAAPARPDASLPDAGPPLYPATLSEAGLFASGIEGPYADGVLQYDVRYPLWTDGAEKRRHLWLPPGTSIDTSDPDQWAFPEGTRLFKEFIVGGVLVETRLLYKAGPELSDWVYVAYRHREDGTDADPVPDGEPDALGTTHDVPSTAECRNCHRGGGDFVLGLGALQLDRVTFDAWTASGVLPAGTVWEEPPGDDDQRQTLGYLHSNCGHCHGPVHPLAMQRTLRLRLPVGILDPYLAPAWVTGVEAEASHDIGGRRVILPGDPARSQLWVRMGMRGELGMPPVGTEVVDLPAHALVRSWIEGGSP